MIGREEVAIVGYAGRLPGVANPEQFWRLLRDNRCATRWLSADRFPTQTFYHPVPQQSGRSYTFAAGLIDDVWGFDAAAFGMSPREAEQVDPQQRHLLEVTHDALAHAGIRPLSLAGSETAVYVGASSVDYGARFFADPSAADVHMMTGNTLSIIANRLSYSLDLHGPSFTVDTACSSSMVALTLAAEAIRTGQIETAIVAGVNLLLSPFSFVGFSRAAMLSPTGQCRPFDADADGYVRAEGIIVLVLQAGATARRSRNRIHATVAGWGSGQDGRTTGLSVPAAESQGRLLEQVYSRFELDPAELAFVEAHGTGTKVGDPIEAIALGQALGQKRLQPLLIGSVKSNIGHLEPASGLAGVLKSILSLNRGMLPATLHQRAPNPGIRFDELNLRVANRNCPLPERRGPAMAGVSSFGFGGSNAHVVLRGEDATVVAHPRSAHSLPPLLLSAHTREALPAVAQSTLDAWPTDERLVPEFIGAAAHLRDALAHRAILCGTTAPAIRHQLEQLAQEGPPSDAPLSSAERDGSAEASRQALVAAAPLMSDIKGQVLAGQALGSDLAVAFVFSGNGAQWAGMGHAAWHGHARFRDALREVDAKFASRQKESLVELLFADDLESRLRHARQAQPLLLALQVATVMSLEGLGLAPAATAGHSVGEIAAAWCAGALSLDQAIDVVIARSRHQETVFGSGTMAALALGEREARRFLLAAETPGVELATINSWRSVTVSGPTAQIERVVAIAAQERIAARRLDLDYPFHSALVDPVRGPLLRELRGLQSRKPLKRLASTVTGNWVESAILDADHWWRNVRAPVRFDAALGRLIADGFRVFVEIGPKPILGSYLRDAMREAGKRGAIVETLTDRAAGEGDPIERSIAQVMLVGGRVDKSRLFGLPPTIAVPQPSYPWRHTSYKVEPTEEASGVFRAADNALLGTQPRADSSEWYATIDGALFPWLDDHKVGELTVFPAACYLEVLAAAAHALHPGHPLEVRELDILRPMVLVAGASFETKVRLAADTGLAEFLSRPRRGAAHSSEGASGGASNWVLHARGVVSRAPGPIDPARLRVAPEALRGGPVIVQKDTVYAVARSLGLAYGPHFQRVSHVSFPERKRALVVLSPEVGVVFDGQTIDVAAFDAAFHALFASDQAGVADMPMARMLPVRFRRVRVFVAGAMASRAIARIRRQSRTSILTDIELIDSTGQRVLLAEEVLLVEAPVAGQPDALNLTYRLTAREHDRPGKPARTIAGGRHHGGEGAGDRPEATASQVGEAALLMEAGCLGAAWQAFRNQISSRLATTPGATANAGSHDVRFGMEPDDRSWPGHLRAALLWHLETRGLVGSREGTPVLSETCPLPTVDTVVRALLSRHPTMAAEAAALARLPQLLERLVAGDSAVATELATAHWRQIGTSGAHVEPLRESVSRRLNDLVGRASGHQLLRVLLIGADHAPFIAQQLCIVPGLELAITDFDEDRLEGARTALGEELSLVRFMPLGELDRTSVQAFDVVAAIDSLSEAAAGGDGLARLARLMRPGATLIAAEPAPGVFWDIARGFRPRWWSRSVNATFPVGALLTEREWQDELAAAGFDDVCSEAVVGSAGVGVAIECLASAAGQLAEGWVAPPDLQWEGDACAAQAALRGVLVPVRAVGAVAASRRRQENSQSIASERQSGVVWSIDTGRYEGAPLSDLGATLSKLAQLCAAQGRLAAVPAPDHAEGSGSVSADKTARANRASDVWVIVSADERHGSEPSDHPLWSAVTAAMRVAQNEYPMLAIRCLGLGDVQPSSLAAAAEEIACPTAERELWFRDGRRLVFRAERGAVEPAPIAPPEAGRGLSVVSRTTGSGGGSSTFGRGTLAWGETRRQVPGPSEVEIAVAATGLNFRDVMWHVGLLPEEALEEGYAGARLGMECSGRVTAIGSQVEGLEVGDSVMAFVSGGFASHVTVPSFAVSRVPATLGLEEAAGLPVAFLTVYYALVHLAGLKAGETLLVHGAAGAVGLAALQVAKLNGAQVIATAGTPEKRALLRALGVKAALDSRTLAFPDEVALHTDGKGVDVVLNSLAGEAMVRSMDCLRPFGRFVELGKRDFYANTPLRLRPLRRNLSYFGVDVDQLIGEQAELAQRLLGELFALFSQGGLTALPYRAFAGQQLGDAFRLMQRSGHIGKIVVRPAAVASDASRAAGLFPVDSGGWHIVIGGTSGLGLATAVWLGERGARRLILASRSGQPTVEAAAEIEQLRGQGIHIDVVSLDVRDPLAVQQLLRRSAASGRVAGIVHAAMVLDDRLMEAMNWEAIDVVLQPKVAGALHLCAAAADFKERGTPLDYLLLFSSATTLLGNPGQFNYVAANGLVEGLARRARRQGLPVLAAAWGGIEDTGYLARNMAGNPALQKRFAANLVPARTALNGLDLARDKEGWTDQAVLTVARLDWASARRELSATNAPTFAGLLPARGARPAAEVAATIEKLRALPLDQAHEILLDIVVTEIAHVLRLPSREIDQNKALADIGMDSLMMMELRGAVEEQLQIELPVLSLASSITPAEIAQRIITVMGGGETAVSGSLAALSGSHVGADPARMNTPDQKVAAEAVIRHAQRLDGPL